MSGKAAGRIELLQGTLDLIVLRALATMGPQDAYGLAARLEQVADHPFTLNQGTLYPALVRLEQSGFAPPGRGPSTTATRSTTGSRGPALDGETARWRRLVHLVDKLLLNEG